MVFAIGDTSKTFTFSAADDTVDDDGESVTLAFGTLPNRVTAGSTATSTVNITDNDTAGVNVSESSLTISEGGSGAYTVKLNTQPSGEVTVTINDPSNTDVTAEPASLTFSIANWNTTQMVTVSAAQDHDGVDDTARVTHAVRGYGSATAADVPVTVTDNDTAGVTVDPAAFTVVPGQSNQYTLALDTEPTAPVTVNVSGQSGTNLTVEPETLTFTADDWSTPQAVTVTAGDDASPTTVTLEHGVSGGDYNSVEAEDATVTITATTSEINIQVGGVAGSVRQLSVPEGGSNSYAVLLSHEPTGDVTIGIDLPSETDLSITPSGGSLIFTMTNWSEPQTVTVFAAEDDDATADDVVTITHTVSGGGYDSGDAFSVEAIIVENDTAGVTVSTDALAVTEGGADTYTIVLDTQPSGPVTVTVTVVDTANNDVSVDNASLTFTAANWNTAQTVRVTVAEDDDAIDDADVTITHAVSGADYDGLTAASVTVSITDNDDPAVTVSFGSTTYTATEGGDVEVTVTLSADPEREVTILLSATNEGGASDADYSGVPASVVFAIGDTSETFTFTATDDDVDDDDESVALAFGSLPTGVTAGSVVTSTVSITDTDDPAVTASFGSATYTAAEGGDVTVTVTLSADPEREVTILLSKTNEGGATTAADSGVPASVVFAIGDTSKTFTFAAADDTVDDDGESVALAFGTLPTGVTAGSTAASTVSITDNDDPAVTVSFGSASYSAAEGDDVEITVTLSADPEREVTILLTKTDEGGATAADYSGVPPSVVFQSGDTSKSFTFTAAQDTVDDDGESVALAFGALPASVTAGSVATSTVSITDNDDPAVTASFGSASCSAAEGDDVEITVTLSADPEREVTILLSATNEGGATTADYSGVPPSVVFQSGDTSKSFTFTAAQDTVDDDGESVALAFGALPASVTAGSVATSTVSITDNDDPAVMVSFGSASYSAAEGDDVTVTIADPEREVTIPVTATPEDGATTADYSGVPASVVFQSGDTSETFTFTAADDTVDDDGETRSTTTGRAWPWPSALCRRG